MVQSAASPSSSNSPSPSTRQSSSPRQSPTGRSKQRLSIPSVRKLVTENADSYIDRLADAVSIASVSQDLKLREKCHEMAQFLDDQIKRLNGRSEKVTIGFQELDSGERFDLPPVILAEFGNADRNKSTVLVYAHYDVQPAAESDGWPSDPFELTEIDGNLYGRGATDDKGPIMAWLAAIDVYRLMEKELPVNLKFCIEGMEESNSECLSDLLERESNRAGFLIDVDYVVVTDNYWITTSKPCLTYGLRGLASFEVDVTAGSQTLHSGVYGGCIAEPMTDLIQLLAHITSAGHGDIPIENCGRDSSAPRTEQEDALYKGIAFDVDQFREEAGGVSELIGADSAKEVLMNRWRYPALSIHGIEPFTGPGLKTVIPGSVSAKFSIRLVPGQDVNLVEKSVRDALEARFKELESPNQLQIRSSASKPWLADPKGPLYQAGASALLRVHGVRPDLTREGGSIPVVSMLQDAIDVETMLLPLGASDDGAHSENEKIGKNNFLNSITVLCTLLDEVSVAHSGREDVPKQSTGAFSRIRDIWYGLS